MLGVHQLYRLNKFTSGVFILFLISSLIFSGLSSTNFVGVSAQTDNNSLQGSTEDRANQTLDNAKKLTPIEYYDYSRKNWPT